MTIQANTAEQTEIAKVDNLVKKDDEANDQLNSIKNEFDTSEVKAVKRVITQVFSRGTFNPASNSNYDYKLS